MTPAGGSVRLEPESVLRVVTLMRECSRGYSAAAGSLGKGIPVMPPGCLLATQLDLDRAAAQLLGLAVRADVVAVMEGWRVSCLLEAGSGDVGAAVRAVLSDLSAEARRLVGDLQAQPGLTLSPAVAEVHTVSGAADVLYQDWQMLEFLSHLDPNYQSLHPVEATTARQQLLAMGLNVVRMTPEWGTLDPAGHQRAVAGFVARAIDARDLSRGDVSRWGGHIGVGLLLSLLTRGMMAEPGAAGAVAEDGAPATAGEAFRAGNEVLDQLNRVPTDGGDPVEPPARPVERMEQALRGFAQARPGRAVEARTAAARPLPGPTANMSTMAQARTRGKPGITGPDSVKLLAYGRPASRRAPEATRLLDWYRQMYLIRRFEEAAAEMYAMGKIGGFLHLYIGEEAIAVGACAALEPQDHLLTHYRDHGYALARGCDTGAVMAELFGRSTGVTRGMGGSMHLVDVERNFWGGHAIVGGHIVIAPGLALAAVMQNQKRVVLDVFGDGATAIGEFHEGVNLAAVWNLPVIFLVENNLYGMGARPEEQFKVPEIFRRAQAYGIPGKRIDGMDVVAVNRAIAEAAERGRSGGGPTIIEAITYRFRGHSMADAESYREKAEVRKWHRRDPIRVLDERLVKGGIVARRELHDIQHQVELQIQDAVVFADNSPFPSLDVLFQNIYAMPLANRGGAVSGPQVVIPELLQRKAARLTQSAEERSRRQPAFSSLDTAGTGGPGGRPTEAAPEPPKGRPRRGKGAAAEEVPPDDAGAAPEAGAAPDPGTAPAPTPINGTSPRRSRQLPQPGRPGRS